MGCGRSAVADDEDEWHDFKKKHSLEKYNWDVYSSEATYAKHGAKHYALTAPLLQEFVSLMLRRDAYNRLMALEATERKEYARLHEKYGNN